MLNTTNIKLGSNSQSVQFNAPCTGILQRSNPNSIFVRFEKGSKMEGMVFPSNGKNPHIHKFDYNDFEYKNYKDGKIEIIVLQILLFGDNQFLVEVIETKFLNHE